MNPPPIVTIAFSHFNDFPSGRQTFLSNIGYPAFYLCSPSKKSGSINCEKPMSVLFLVQMPVCERGCGSWGRGGMHTSACARACVCVSVRARARAPRSNTTLRTQWCHTTRGQKEKKEKKIDFSKGPDCHALATSRRAPRNTNTEEESRTAPEDARAEISKGVVSRYREFFRFRVLCSETYHAHHL